MTILKQLKKSTGLELITTTTCFNIYNVDIHSIGFNKSSNLHKTLKTVDWEGDESKGDDFVTVAVGAKGRSQHSATELLIFKGVLPPDHGLLYNVAEYKLSCI